MTSRGNHPPKNALNSASKFTTFDGRNPAPPGMYKTHVDNGIFTISTG